MEISPELWSQLIPLAIEWSRAHEHRILSHGHSLKPEELLHAAQAGVIHPERIRFMVVPEIPGPDSGILGTANATLGMVNDRTAGLTLNYGIYIRADCSHDEALFFHEFVHVSQYERLGGFEGFLARYLQECLQLGYENSPLEKEAVDATLKFESAE
jgi:hypothetical protein